MVVGKFIILNQDNPPININSILGGGNNYERVVVSPIGIGEIHKLQGVGENLGAVYIGDSNVDLVTFDDIVITGQHREYTTDDYANIGTDMFVFVPQSTSVKVAVLGFAI
jgi:hypothetical protein